MIFNLCVFFYPSTLAKCPPPPFNMPRHRNVKDKLRCSNSLSLKFAQCQRQKGWKWNRGKYFYIVLSTFLKTLANLEPSLNILCPNSKYCFSVQTQANTTHRKNKACIQIPKWLREIFWLWYLVINCNVSDQLLYITMTYYNLRRRSWILSCAYHDTKVSVFLPSPWINQSVNEREY